MSGCDKSIDEVPLCPHRMLDEFRNRVCRKDEGTRCPGADAPKLPDFVPPHEQGVIVVLAEPPKHGTPEEQAEWCQDLRDELIENLISANAAPFVTSSKNIAGGGALAPDCLNFIIGAGTVPIRQWAAQRKRLRWEAHEPFDAPASTPTGALAAQVGGDHYKSMKIQPVEYIHRNGIGFIEGCVIKYVSRWRAKNGVQDLEKARHFLNILIQMEGQK